MPTITDKEFRLFQELIRRESGIELGSHKRALLVGRLARVLRECGLASFSAYYERVVRGGEEEMIRLLDRICTNETHFFREPEHFRFLHQHVFDEIEEQAAAGRRRKSIRIWSAACSTGEEPYSLAMALLTRFPRGSGWDLEIAATDLSTTVLERATAATWPIQKSTEIEPSYLRRFMLRGTGSQNGKMRACAELRSLVRFSRLNLNDESYDLPGLFDAIFCRNVLIYFNAEVKARVVKRLSTKLVPRGYLFLGHAETLSGLAEDAKCMIPNVYRFNPPGSPRPSEVW